MVRGIWDRELRKNRRGLLTRIFSAEGFYGESEPHNFHVAAQEAHRESDTTSPSSCMADFAIVPPAAGFILILKILPLC
jgi:hypothetical protein